MFAPGQTRERVLAVHAAGLPGLGIGADKERNVPAEIQFLPPGINDLVPAEIDGKPNDEMRPVRLRVDASTARRLQSLLEGALADYSAGRAPRPWLDENHLGQRSVGWPVEFRWGGEDPKAGGVRLQVKWSGLGESLIKSGAYSFFSPSLLVEVPDQDGDTVEVMGLYNNIGGLVNEPAFRNIQQIAARGAALATTINHKQTEKDSIMEEALKKLTESMDEVKARLQKIEAAAAGFATVTLLEDRDKKIAGLEKTLADAKADGNRKAAQAIVASAVQAGKLAPQDTETQKKWEDTLAADPSRSELLTAMPANPALQSITAGARPGGAKIVDQAQAIQSAVREYQDSHAGCSYERAWQAVRANKPELFKS